VKSLLKAAEQVLLDACAVLQIGAVLDIGAEIHVAEEIFIPGRNRPKIGIAFTFWR